MGVAGRRGLGETHGSTVSPMDKRPVIPPVPFWTGVGLSTALTAFVLAVLWWVANDTGAAAERLALQGQLIVAGLSWATALALVWVTIYYAAVTRSILRANERLIEETTRARQDNLAPRLSILLPLPDHASWFHGREFQGQDLTPLAGRSFVVPEEQAMRVAARFQALVTNESETSVLLTVDSSTTFGFNKGTGNFALAVDAPLPQRLGDGRFVLRPKTNALLLIEPEHTVTEWVDAPDGIWDRVVIDASLQIAPTVVDRWTLRVRTRPLERDPNDAGRIGPTPSGPQPFVPELVMSAGIDGPERLTL